MDTTPKAPRLRDLPRFCRICEARDRIVGGRCITEHLHPENERG